MSDYEQVDAYWTRINNTLAKEFGGDLGSDESKEDYLVALALHIGVEMEIQKKSLRWFRLLRTVRYGRQTAKRVAKIHGEGP